jgi:hypothetical protein
MAQYDGLKITVAGRNLLAKAVAGAELHFTRLSVGDGFLPADTDIYTLPGLIHPLKDVPIDAINTSPVGQAIIIAKITNEGVNVGFWARELGLFALDPDIGEILYGYTNAGDRSDYIPGQNGADIYRSQIYLVTVIDQAANVTAVLSGDPLSITWDDLNNAITQLESQIASLFQPSAPIADFWTRTANDGNVLRPATLEEAKIAILGVTDIASLNRRLERAEDNIGEIILVLDAKSIYPEYSHYLLENFNPPDQIDTYSCQVLSVVAGDDSLDCNPVAGMIPGSYYTITDGINFELVQVKSVSLENGIQRVILTAPIDKTYKLGSCQLYRTSATIQDGKVYGPTTARTQSWSTSTEWKGQDANAEFDIPLDVALNTVQITGDIAVTAEGLITLGTG